MTVAHSDGLKWIMRGHAFDDHLGPRDHEPGLYPKMLELFPDDGVFLDIGAHIGRYTMRFARHALHVYAVEAVPSTAGALRANIELNELDNVTVINKALWSKAASLTFTDPNNKVDGGSARGVPGDGDIEGHPVDGVLALIPSVDLVKMDVEGAEGHVLEGGRQMFDKWSPVMVIEMHDRMYGEQIYRHVVRELDGLGYEWEPFYEYNQAWYLKAWRR